MKIKSAELIYREKSQKEKILYISSHIYGIPENGTDEPILQGSKGDIDIGSRLDTVGGGEAIMN